MARTIKQLGDLQPDISNANKGTQRGRGMVEASLRETGAGRSILADREGRIIAGNKTLEAWADIGGEIEVVRTNGDKLVVVQREDLDLTDETGTARKLAYYDNRAGEVGLEWDAEQLLADINAGMDLSSMFHDDELDALLADLQPKPEVNDDGAQVDRAEELRVKWGTATGQVWRLGAHKLICGDCTDAGVVARVMGGERAQAAVTDPPYNVRDDAWDKFDDFLLFTRKWLVVAKDHAPLIASFFPDKFLPLLAKAAEMEGLPFRRSLVWVKPPGSQFAGGQKDGFWFDFEFVQVYGEPAIEPPKSPKFSVFDYRTITGQEHGAEKPSGLYADIWTNYTSQGGIVLEPFSGTGSNLIACEQLGRKCRAVEISPAYVAVALDRWATATGETPVLVDEVTL